jgi:protein SCO1
MSDPAPSPSLFRTPPAWVVLGFLVLGIAAVIAAFFIPVPVRPDSTGRIPNADPPTYHDAPPFLLTERNGAEIGNADLDGKVWVASFQFTRCQFCPNVAATLSRLQGEIKLSERDDVRFVTFTIDPDHDTPDELKKYADSFRADPKKWWFLTGKDKVIKQLVNRGFKVAAVKNDKAPVNRMYDHSLKLLLIDKRGRIRGTYDGMVGQPDPDQNASDAELKQLKEKYDESCKELKRQIEVLVKE